MSDTDFDALCEEALRDPIVRAAYEENRRQRLARKGVREIDAPVHRGCYSDNKHIQFACDGSWNEPKWGSDDDRKTTDPEVHVSDDDRLYTFNSAKATCEGCK